MAFWIIIFLGIVSMDRVYSLDESTLFVKESISNVKDRTADGCTMELPVPSLVRCLVECSRRSLCIGASLEKNTGNCFIHHVCNLNPRSDTPDPNHDYYASYCVHGRWDSATHSCVCQFGTFGDRCDKAHRLCDHTAPGVYSFGSYPVYLDPLGNGYLYKVRCAPGGKVQLMRNDGGMSFNRTWNEYVYGFESPDTSDHWLGLKAWHALTNNPPCNSYLFITVKFGKPVSDSYISFFYTDFVVGSKESKFPFTFRSSNAITDGTVPSFSTAGECMSSVQNRPFSTWDRISDKDTSQTCPSRVGSGWWHAPDCDNPCNLLGWGLEDLVNTPRDQRLSMFELDMNVAGEKINFVDIAYSCM